MTNKRRMSTEKMVLGAVMTALVIVLQLIGSFIRFGPFSISLVLIPIVIGAATCGIGVGGWLGFVFGLVVLMSGDAAAFLQIDPLGTVITVLLKGTCCGLAAGAVYKLLEKRDRYVGVIAAAIVCPVVNTGIFLLGCLVFFMDTIASWAGEGQTVAQYMIFGLVGANFLFEFASNILLSPVIVRLLNIKDHNHTKLGKPIVFHTFTKIVVLPAIFIATQAKIAQTALSTVGSGNIKNTLEIVVLSMGAALVAVCFVGLIKWEKFGLFTLFANLGTLVAYKTYTLITSIITSIPLTNETVTLFSLIRIDIGVLIVAIVCAVLVGIYYNNRKELFGTSKKQ